MNITFRQLKVFSEVARLNSVVRASEALHLTPPAVSLQVKSIEKEVGHTLFDRAGKRMTLTVAGEYFVVHARRLLAGLKEADEAMLRFDNLESGHLNIAMVSAAKYFLPHMLSKFHKEHPSVDIRLKLGSRDQIDEMLINNEVDLCLMGRPPRKVPVVAQAFAEHPHVLVMSPKHELARIDFIPANALVNVSFIVRETTSGTRSAFQEFLDQHQLQPNITMEMGSSEAIKQAVIANMGVSFLSQHILAQECANGSLIVPKVEGLPLMRHWHIVSAASKQLSPAASAFRQFVLKDGEAHIDDMQLQVKA
ncbi:MAG: LysR substrate-binding domain-containing protein [Granulosicoccaceae bacterium]